MRKLLGIFVVAAVAAFATGCGGGGGSSSTQTVPAAQYRKTVNALCARAENKKFVDIGVAFRKKRLNPNNMSQKDVNQMTIGVVLPVFEEMTEKLQQLPLPAGQEDKAKEMISQYEADIQKTKQDPGRFLEGTAFTEGNEAAKRLGLTACVF
jgi:hypothetical protein